MKSENMGFLIVSEGGDGFGLAMRLKAEGHKVSMWIRETEFQDRGDNMIEKGNTTEFLPIVVADCTGAGALLDVYRDSGHATFGGSQVMDRLETDRKYASEIMKRCGLKQPNSKEFTSWEDAEAFVAKQDPDTRLVFKPEGRFSGNTPSFVSHDNDEMLKMLRQYKTEMGEFEPEFLLQEFIDGICISSEAWYAKNHFVKPFNHTLERKQLMNDDLGPSGGCTGNIVWRCDEEKCPLCAELLKLEEFLEEVSYNGPIDINSVVDSEGNIYALEFTSRFGYDAFPTLLYGLFDGDFGAFIRECALGNGPAEMPLRDGYAAGIRLSLPPWPSEGFASKEGIPIGNLRLKDFERFYPYEVSLRESGEFVTAGGVGIVGLAIGYSDRLMSEAFEEAYRFIKRLKIPNLQYRTDLEMSFKKDLRLLSRYLTVKV